MPVLPPIKKNDEVFILRGKDRGKTGRVLIVVPKDQKVVVEGVQMIKRHTRAEPATQYQRRYRREGSADPYFERRDRLQELQETHSHCETRCWRMAVAFVRAKNAETLSSECRMLCERRGQRPRLQRDWRSNGE